MRVKHPLKSLLHSAGIPKSSFHYHIGKPDPDAAAQTAVSEVYRQHKGRYGRRRIAAVLSWNKKKVGRIMGLLGLKAKVRSKRTYRPQSLGEASANILNREFSADKSGDKWLTDVTEFKCTDGKLYLSPILDVFNREIVAYSLSRRANGEMVTQMPDNALSRLKGQRRCCIPTKVYCIGQVLIGRNWLRTGLCKACRAKEIAGTMRRWRVSSAL